MRAMPLATLILLLRALAPGAAHASPGTPIDVSVESSGHYVIQSHGPDFTFVGEVGQPVSNLRASDGRDAVGPFHQVDFDYGARTSEIRAYAQADAVLFTTTYSAGAPNATPFPVLSSLPALPYKLSYHDTPFSPYQLNTLREAADSPWLFFDSAANGYLISPANDFPLARMTLSDDGTLSSGIDAGVANLPQGFAHGTLLVIGTGLNHLFDTWGQTLTALHAKSRPPNDADLTLEKFGYWTDNGATYYYHFEPQLGYEGTLLSITREFNRLGIALGYLQLDSWWYPKGPNARWNDTAGGIFRYRAAPDLFPEGLQSFQQQVGLPLVTHARWIDPASPYRGEFSFSGNVMTDLAYWSDLMSYLHSGGVVTYEQDWLGAQAQPTYDLSAPRQFMGNMASAAQQQGLTLQYCMPLPRHVLQTVEYGNVTSMRVSDDRFDRNRWDTFLYTSRLASALGVWPWSDVFMSAERNNLLLADLSAGVVGTGDALGAENADNLHHVMRADAVLVKPDAPLVPTDQSMIDEAAQGSSAPMVAWTYSDHAGLRGLYLFAYSRTGGPGTVTFTPAALGLSGASYVYDYFDRAGRVLEAGEAFTESVGPGTYYVVAPIGSSGIAFLGDSGEFASLGRKRISSLSDDGTVHATVELAAGENAVTLFGYAPTAPVASVQGGSADPVAYDTTTQQYTVTVRTNATPSQVTVDLSLS
jgi:hypothetical protein